MATMVTAHSGNTTSAETVTVTAAQPKMAELHSGVRAHNSQCEEKSFVPLLSTSASSDSDPMPMAAGTKAGMLSTEEEDVHSGHSGRESPRGRLLFALLSISMMVNVSLNKESRFSFSSTNKKLATTNNDSNENATASASTGWIQPDTVFGLLHMAKTAGTTINGQLANHFERVCGNKGWSYDAYQANERAKQFLQNHPNYTGLLTNEDMGDSISKHYKRKNRGKVPNDFMNEVGYEDCDYIAREGGASLWKHYTKKWKMELHVPCRDPLSHLMSQCNYRHKSFKCANSTGDMREEIDKCMVFMNRFSNEAFDSDPNVTLKCFNPLPPSKYVNYMGTILQRKRLESKYVQRETNMPRDKNSECIWSASEEYKEEVKRLMVDEFDYYGFCDKCMESENELSL